MSNTLLTACLLHCYNGSHPKLQLASLASRRERLEFARLQEGFPRLTRDAVTFRILHMLGHHHPPAAAHIACAEPADECKRNPPSKRCCSSHGACCHVSSIYFELTRSRKASLLSESRFRSTSNVREGSIVFHSQSSRLAHASRSFLSSRKRAGGRFVARKIAASSR